MLSKSLIQFSIDGWGCVPSLLFELRPNYGGGNEDNRITLVTQTIKYLSAMQKIQVLPLGWEDPQEKEMATHSSILAWEIPWAEEPGRITPIGVRESDTT